jgi:hypothetical protein
MLLVLFHLGIFALALLFTLWMLRRRRRRKALVAAALAVINNYRRYCNHPYPLSQFKERCQTAVVMERLIDATQYVN